MYKQKYLKYKAKYFKLKCEELPDQINNPINEPINKPINEVKVIQKDGNVVILDSFSYNSNSATIVDGQTNIMLIVSFTFKNIQLSIPNQGKTTIYKIWENTQTNDGLPSFWKVTFENEKVFYKIVLKLLNKCAELLTNEVNKNEGQIACLNMLNTNIIPTLNLYITNGKQYF
jgi:hypothetical protein